MVVGFVVFCWYFGSINYKTFGLLLFFHLPTITLCDVFIPKNGVSGS